MEFLSKQLSKHIESGNINKVKELFKPLSTEEKQELVNSKHNDITALFAACVHGNLELVKFFIEECSADIELKGVYCVEEADNSKHVVPPLWCASISNKTEIVKYLLDHGADINSASDSNSTSVRAACFRNNLDIVRLLVERGADISIPNKSGSTCLMNAVECPELCRYLISQGAKVNAVDKNDLTPLHYAVIYNNVDSIDVMIDSGADMSLCSKDGYNVITMSALYSTEHITQHIIKNVKLPNADKIRAYELMAAKTVDDHDDDFQKYQEYLVQAITMRQTDPTVSVESPKTSQLRSLLPPFTEPNTVDEFGKIFGNVNIRLHSLIIKDRILGSNDYNTIYGLLRFTADLLRQQPGNEWKSYELYKYAYEIYLKDCKVLMDNCLYSLSQILQVLHDMKQSCVNCPKMLAAINEMFRLLTQHLSKAINYMKEKDAKTQKEKNFNQVMKVCLDFVYLLSSIQFKCDEDQFDRVKKTIHTLLTLDPRARGKGCSLLHMAVYPRGINRCYFFDESDDGYNEPNINVVRILIQSGANVNSVDCDKNTPLHIYLEHEICEPDDIYRLFLQSGSHYDTPNIDGKSVMDLMRVYGRHFVQELRYCNLQCLAARTIQKYKIPYSPEEVPSSLIKFIELH